MKKRIFPIIFVAVFILSTFYHYSINYKIRTVPPSEKWAKDVKISEGNLKTYPKIIKFKGNYVVIHDDGDLIKLVSIDSNGNKLKEKTFPGEDTLIRDVAILTDGKDIYINWLTKIKGINYASNMILDEDFNTKKSWKEQGPIESTQIGDGILGLLYSDKVEIRDIKEGKSYTKKIGLSSMLAGTTTKDGYLISFWENEMEFKYFYIKDGKVSETKLAAPFFLIKQRSSLFKTAIACDEKNGYIVLEMRSRDSGFGIGSLITFSLDGSQNPSTKALNITGKGNVVYNPVSVESGDKARFLIACERIVGKDNNYNNIAEFSIKNGEIKDVNFISKTQNPSICPHISGNIALFCAYEDEKIGVYISSSDNSFKEKHNPVRKYERNLAISDTLNGMLSGFFHNFVLGLRWLFPELFIGGILVLINNGLKSRKSKLISFSVGSVLAALIKFQVFYSLFYSLYPGSLPGILENKIIFTLINLMLSIACFYYGFEGYKKRLEIGYDSMPIFNFSIAFVIDSILTLQIFYPFLP